MLRVAIQMDPIEAVNIESDTTWLMMTTAQDRGHSQWVYDFRTLALEDGRLFCRARPVTLKQVVGDHVTFGDEVKLDLSQDVDVILMRQDPPFDMAYVTATYLLETVHPRTLVVNDPAQVRSAPEKLMVTAVPGLQPPTLISSDVVALTDFHERHGDVVHLASYAPLLAKKGLTDPVAIPDISTKAKAQAVLGMDMEKLNAEKEAFKKETAAQKAEPKVAPKPAFKPAARPVANTETPAESSAEATAEAPKPAPRPAFKPKMKVESSDPKPTTDETSTEDTPKPAARPETAPRGGPAKFHPGAAASPRPPGPRRWRCGAGHRWAAGPSAPAQTAPRVRPRRRIRALQACPWAAASPQSAAPASTCPSPVAPP